MTQIEARQKTIQRFTNLLDGTVKPNIGPGQIIDYYQSLLNNTNLQISMPLGNIEKKFQEAELQYELDEYDEYYGNEL